MGQLTASGDRVELLLALIRATNDPEPESLRGFPFDKCRDRYEPQPMKGQNVHKSGVLELPDEARANARSLKPLFQ